MTSPFVSVPQPPPPGSPHLVENDGWWPDIDLNLLRLSVPIDTTITPERLREATVNAIVGHAAELADWQTLKEAAGAEDLAAVEARQVGGESILVALYRRAIHSTVSADLSERLASITATTAAGVERAEELRCAVDDHRRAARWAIRDLLGKRRSTVELI